MSIFVTEFPISGAIDKATFLSQVIAWLRGNQFSRVLDEAADQDLDRSFAHLRSANGEELIFRELIRSGSTAAIGFRHDLPDDAGRLWRTETVLKYDVPVTGISFITFKTQCIAIGPTARTDVPRKPYLIKSIISDLWPTFDGHFRTSDKPLWLRDTHDIELAKLVFEATATVHLPVVYVSAKAKDRWSLSARSIEKLAYDLGGVAHVVVEPSRAFSFDLRDALKGQNAYGGVIAVVAPQYGVLQRLHADGLSGEQDFVQNIISIALTIRSRMPAAGWDWLNLQEASLHEQRIRERNRLTSGEIESIYQDEINTKDERIRQLEIELAARPITVPSDSPSTEHNILDSSFIRTIGPEVYPNEFSDRIRAAVISCIKQADTEGLDKRSRYILNTFLDNSSFSNDVGELRSDLRRATRDAKRMTSEIIDLLSRHGYYEKSDNKHIRLEPKSGLAGLDKVTLSKTPGDHRSLENTRKQIEKTLGISKF